MSEQYPCAEYEGRFQACLRTHYSRDLVRAMYMYMAVDERPGMSENPSPCQRELDQYMDCLSGVPVADLERRTRQILRSIGENSSGAVDKRNGKI